ncbi:MAG TPA: PLP-dependent aminotransferase family protein, partial [Azospirillaceae bacterium]|nr:PLP-dependent aminotransferase family protein [Azospirillaceae bacterium]
MSVNGYIVSMTNWFPDVTERHGPMYRAIADALAEDIAAGRIASGTRLPTHRDLAFRLKVTVGTITRAYAEAEKRGLIGGEVGRGTFVLSDTRSPSPDGSPWPPSVETPFINMTVCQPLGTDAERAVTATVTEIAASGQMGTLMGYGPHAGLMSHRIAAAQWMARQHGVETAPETVLITMGAQNATAIATATLTQPGDLVVTERLTYYGAKAVCSMLGLHLEGLAMDEEGLLPDAFESACRRLAPKLLYTVPTLQNPTTAIQPAPRRARITE